MKGLFWCQYILGIGHLMRGLRLSQSLTHYFDLDFLQGGRDVNLTCSSPRFHKINLPAISNNDLSPITGVLASKYSVPTLFQERQKVLESALNEPYDFCFVGSFPLGKFSFAGEIVPLLERLKKNNPACVIISSVNDFAYLEPEYTHEASRLLHTYFDYLFIHADPEYMRVEDYSIVAREAQDMSFYTGYVTAPLSPIPPKREKQILISTGGGGVCEELARAVAEVSIYFPDYKFLFALGPNAPMGLQKDLKMLQHLGQPSNIELTEFIENFTNTLCQSALAITTAGSTLADLCLTRTPGMAYPYISAKSNEQFYRAQKFAEKGAVSLLTPADLKPAKLAQLIHEKMQTPYPEISINANGAANSTHKLIEILHQRKGL